jgi:ribosomal protein S16
MILAFLGRFADYRTLATYLRFVGVNLVKLFDERPRNLGEGRRFDRLIPILAAERAKARQAVRVKINEDLAVYLASKGIPFAIRVGDLRCDRIPAYRLLGCEEGQLDPSSYPKIAIRTRAKFMLLGLLVPITSYGVSRRPLLDEIHHIYEQEPVVLKNWVTGENVVVRVVVLDSFLYSTKITKGKTGREIGKLGYYAPAPADEETILFDIYLRRLHGMRKSGGDPTPIEQGAVIYLNIETGRIKVAPVDYSEERVQAMLARVDELRAELIRIREIATGNREHALLAVEQMASLPPGHYYHQYCPFRAVCPLGIRKKGRAIDPMMFLLFERARQAKRGKGREAASSQGGQQSLLETREPRG